MRLDQLMDELKCNLNRQIETALRVYDIRTTVNNYYMRETREYLERTYPFDTTRDIQLALEGDTNTTVRQLARWKLEQLYQEVKR
jgi:hypothetical protein